MPRRKKNFKLSIYYHFLIQIWRLELSTRDKGCVRGRRYQRYRVILSLFYV